MSDQERVHQPFDGIVEGDRLEGGRWRVTFEPVEDGPIYEVVCKVDRQGVMLHVAGHPGSEAQLDVIFPWPAVAT